MVWLVPQPAMGPGDGLCSGGWQILPWVKLGKDENPNQQPPHLLQGHQSKFMQVSCGQKAKVLPSSGSHNTGAATHRQRWDHSAHHIAVSILFPQKGNKIFGFKAGKGAVSVLRLLRSLGVLPLVLPARQSASLRGT